ncbi:hypothetical protein J3454_15975 [Erythrobacter sp. NFXS35]|uniref:hypothetical protein n=1 Tax=Erythrobacter sp. NFXS35 TaxID=2818436 RepID=UPI0032DFF009
MTNQLIPHDPYRLRLQAATRITDPSKDVAFPQSESASGVADTHFIIHRDGNGASTLALFLEVFMRQEPLIIEVGTNVSRALQSVPDTRRHHIQESDGEAVARAIDWRLERPGTPAIIECGRSLYKSAIEWAHVLSRDPFSGRVPMFFVASEHDREFKVARFARQCGLADVLVVGEAQGSWAGQEIAIPIPRLNKDFEKLIYGEGLSLREAFEHCQNAFTRTAFFQEFVGFGAAVKGRLEG